MNHTTRSVGRDTVTSGIEGAWTAHPTTWDNGYFHLLFQYEWQLTKSPAGAWQWEPIDIAEEDMPVDVEDPSIKLKPMMTDADMAMIKDPIYREISKRYYQDPEYFCRHVCSCVVQTDPPRHGAKSPLPGPDVPDEELIWQDPVPAGTTSYDVRALKAKIQAVWTVYF